MERQAEGMENGGERVVARLTLRDVACAAGVSLSTASRVSRGAPSVRPDVRQRVLEAIERLGYYPDAAARSIRTGQSHAVGYAVADITNPFFAAIVQGATAVLEKEGYALLLASAGNDPVTEERALRSLRARRVDGLVLSVTDEDAPHLQWYSSRIPAVLIDREVRGALADAVRSDHAAGLGEAVAHLVGLGHRHIALLTGSRRQLGTRARIDAFCAAARAGGLTPDEAVVRSDAVGLDACRRVAADLLAARGRPTALLVASYDLLVGTLAEIRTRGLRLPDDISLVACEDLDLCSVTTPGLDVVRRDVDRLGGEAARMLLDRIGGRSPAVPVSIELPTTFVRRGSTSAPALP